MKQDPRGILALTFTNKAANEMRERVEAIIGETAKQMIISTFHSLCTKFLQREYYHFYKTKTKFVILDRIDQIDVLKTVYKNNEISPSTLDYASMLEYISYHKINFISPADLKKDLTTNADEEEVNDKLKITIYEQYQQILQAANSLDFDDLMVKTKEILTQNQQILTKWQGRFKYFLIDEFQDTSKLQYEIISLLAKSNNITIVGDPDQTIYSWRGADISFINNFDKLHPKTFTVVLHQNYRSTQRILEAANNLIKFNPNRLEKVLDTANPTGEKIEFYVANSPEFETMWIISKINDLKKMKVQLKDIAILYRLNYYSRAIEDALINETIPHKIVGGQKFYERVEIKDALTFLRCIWSPNDVALERIINIPARKIGDATLKKLFNFAKAHNLSLWDSWIQKFPQIHILPEPKNNLFKFINCLLKHRAALTKGVAIHQVLESFLNEIGYLNLLKQNQVEHAGTNKLENVKELIKAIKSWGEKNKDKTIDDYLYEIALINLNHDDTNNLNYVSLMTVHAAKGLEFKNVFVIGLNEGTFPTAKALEDEANFGGALLEEERRLAYVAITRAKERLFLSSSRTSLFAQKMNHKSSISPSLNKPSQFLTEMGLNLSGFVKADTQADQNPTSHKGKYFHPGDKIMHTNFGEGIVLDINGDTIIIEFKNKNVGVKQLLKNHKSIERL